MECFSVLLLIGNPCICPIIVSLTKHESLAKESGFNLVKEKKRDVSISVLYLQRNCNAS